MIKPRIFNAYKGGVVRTIKAQYNNTSFANLIRGDSFGASAVVMEKVKVKEATAKGYAEIGVGGVMSVAYPESETRRGRVIEEGNISPTLDTVCHIGQLTEDMRIRKLTPKECFRLQGFPDEYFERAASVCSDAQLYKQAGNSVTVNVIYEIAKRLEE